MGEEVRSSVYIWLCECIFKVQTEILGQYNQYGIFLTLELCLMTVNLYSFNIEVDMNALTSGCCALILLQVADACVSGTLCHVILTL